VSREIKIVCSKRIHPNDNGWFKKIKIIENIQFKINIYINISGNSLTKILILEIKDEGFFFPEVLKELSYFWFTRSVFYLNY